jgi:hypothetical protein
MSEKLKKQSVIISLIWAFVGTIGVVYYIKIGTGMDVSPNYANNIIYYFIYAASAFIAVKLSQRRKRFLQEFFRYYLHVSVL